MVGTKRRDAAFTLIEMLAVVAIFALLATFVLPNIASLSARALKQQASHLASQLELARQRSVVTAIPHRILIDLESGAYRLEWQGLPPEEEALDLLPPPVTAETRIPISLAAPPEEQREYEPLPGLFGRFTYLERDLAFVGLETNDGWIERGEVSVDFDRDGTTDYTEIVLDNEAGQTLTLDVLPLADAVRIRDETS